MIGRYFKNDFENCKVITNIYTNTSPCIRGLNY